MKHSFINSQRKAVFGKYFNVLSEAKNFQLPRKDKSLILTFHFSHFIFLPVSRETSLFYLVILNVVVYKCRIT